MYGMKRVEENGRELGTGTEIGVVEREYARVVLRVLRGGG